MSISTLITLYNNTGDEMILDFGLETNFTQKSKHLIQLHNLA